MAKLCLRDLKRRKMAQLKMLVGPRIEVEEVSSRNHYYHRRRRGLGLILTSWGHKKVVVELAEPRREKKCLRWSDEGGDNSWAAALRSLDLIAKLNREEDARNERGNRWCKLEQRAKERHCWPEGSTMRELS
ncbi:hypothetical protein CDL15_Pgr026356 [Punica granatum]|uniref:Uncharacterized protein n=1 Tax=Punica granatum TaxID=22663 RepID=A0A218XNI2_PUNGR|nr:hypothetical protein CDL15_Pgr026356 [Punica granatum]PKI51897.1 hypothetical protein CRG98_027730 [Punica granatum]